MKIVECQVCQEEFEEELPYGICEHCQERMEVEGKFQLDYNDLD